MIIKDDRLNGGQMTNKRIFYNCVLQLDCRDAAQGQRCHHCQQNLLKYQVIIE